MAVEVVGKDELSSLSAFLDRLADGQGPVALALEGEADRQVDLWRAAVEDARARGLRVLSTRPAESERALASAGLGDLLDGVLDRVLPDLTPPRRRALEVSLLVEDAAGQPVDQRALGLAVFGALELLAEDGLVLAVDDLQWLGRLVCRRARVRAPPSSQGEDPRGLDAAARRAGGIDRRRRCPRRCADRARPRRPLSVGATHQVLRSLHAGGLPRPTLLRVHDVGRESVLRARACSGARR